jgi:hypothetical protein
MFAPRALKPCALSLFVLVGCARRAPGPEECLQLAETWSRSRLVFGEQTGEQAFEELTVRCLTQPFEREFVQCVNKRGLLKACQRERAGQFDDLP